MSKQTSIPTRQRQNENKALILIASFRGRSSRY
nr:MAG TPA: hypothetical protein [Caudoviricetes sp.]